ncbi:MAG TPA: hypothetical protein VFL42_15170 [Terriglobales bacterium]|nr:hypothetical protein [Terriglobales bacterium]
MKKHQDTAAQEHVECIDPGRILLHATFYVWKQARKFPLAAWLDAEEILRRARNDFEDEDRIAFVRRIEQYQMGELKAAVLL